jgi:biopolymer transport protein TolR
MGANVQHGDFRRRRGRRPRRPPMSEINVTPFVDVMLVLLIIFMMTARMITVGVPVELPGSKAQALDDSRKQEPLTISVNREGKIFVQESEITLDEIAPKLAALAKGGFEQAVFVRGDKRANYGALMSVMSRISTAGFKRISLVTDPAEPM